MYLLFRFDDTILYKPYIYYLLLVTDLNYYDEEGLYYSSLVETLLISLAKCAAMSTCCQFIKCLSDSNTDKNRRGFAIILCMLFLNKIWDKLLYKFYIMDKISHYIYCVKLSRKRSKPVFFN